MTYEHVRVNGFDVHRVPSGTESRSEAADRIGARPVGLVQLAREDARWGPGGSRAGWPASADRRVRGLGDHAHGGHRPGPRRTGPSWKEFLTNQAQGIIAADFAHPDTAGLGTRTESLRFLLRDRDGTYG